MISALNSPELRAAIVEVIRQRKKAWGFQFAAIYLIPLLEVATLGCAYLLFDENKRASFNQFIQNVGVGGALNIVTADNRIFLLTILIGGIISAVLYALVKYQSNLIATKLKIFYYIHDSRRVIDGYLNTSPTIARNLGKDGITSGILNDVGGVANLLKSYQQVAVSIFGVITFLVGAVWVSWQLLLVILLIYILPVYVTRGAFKELRGVGKKQVTRREQMMRQLFNFVEAYERTKMDSLEEILGVRSVKHVARSRNLLVDEKRVKYWYATVNETSNLIGLLLFVYVSVVVIGAAAETFIAMLVIFNRLRTYVTGITSGMLGYQNKLAQIERFSNLVSKLEKNRSTYVPDSKSKKSIIKEVEVRDASYAYGENIVLRNVNFHAKSGDRVIIQGPSGTGKTTFLELLLGFLRPDTGTVTYNGHELDESLFLKMREQVAVVSPDVFLFDDTLRRNLDYGKKVSNDVLFEAIENAQLKEVVAALPNGLESEIGPGGKNLSLGQKQRVILARLFLRQPSLVLLDEATANLEATQESSVLRAIELHLKGNGIVIMVAHKAPEFFQNVRKFWLEDGVLSESR